MATTITERHVASTQPGGMKEEVVRGTVDTDANGDGTLSVPLAGYGMVPVVQATSANTAGQNATPNGVDLAVTGAAASSTVDVEAVIHGLPGVA
ncbi:hypothetical protein [Halococcus sp. PRR34]|uniref:hypothetical protein n=1 Tax=Halococcus sp. PRR34 TaxID=3020830 RepID=UPI00236097A9|nr:hypothetical protein [Halococcus sp. PRR34]